MLLKITVEDKIVCKPDTIILKFNYFDKKASIGELKVAFENFINKLKSGLSDEGLDESNLELGKLRFSKSYKTVMVEKSAFLSNKSEKVNERRPDGFDLSCSISYVDKIDTKGVSSLYLKLMGSLPYVISLDFECRDMDKYKDELLEQLLKKGQHKAELVAKTSGMETVKLSKVDFSVRITQVSYHSYDFDTCCCDDMDFACSEVESFIDSTEKAGQELTDNLTLEYEIS